MLRREPLVALLALSAASGGCHRDEARKPAARREVTAHRAWTRVSDAAPADAGPYASLAIQPTLVEAQPGQVVWAAAEDGRGQWTLNVYTAVATEGLVWTLEGKRTMRAPQGLVAPVAGTLPPPGTPVMIATDRPTFGLMKEGRGDKALVRYMYFGGGMRDALVEAQRVRGVNPDREAFGAPAAIEVDGQWRGGVVVGRTNGGWGVIRGSGKNSTVARVSADHLRFVDPSAHYPKGTAVLFGPDASSSDPVWRDGTVVSPVADGLGYQLRTADGRVVQVSWALVVPRP